MISLYPEVIGCQSARGSKRDQTDQEQLDRSYLGDQAGIGIKARNAICRQDRDRVPDGNSGSQHEGDRQRHRVVHQVEFTGQSPLV